MYKKILWAMTLSLTLILSSTGFAHSSMCREKLDTMIESLKLDDQQKEKIKPILAQLKTTMSAAMTQMNSVSTQLDQQVWSTSMNEDTVNSLIDQKTKLIGEMMKAKMKAKNEVFTILTAAQRTVLQNRMKTMEEKIAAKFKNCNQDE